MAQSILPGLFADLQRLGQNGQYDRAIKVVNKILQESPEDETAFTCKIVCFIQLGKFEEALAAIRKNAKLASCVVFEKAYCEYRLNRTNEALKTLDSSDKSDDRISELRGQVLYRLEKYDECFDIYRGLLKNTEDDFEEERETNLSAVMAAMQLWGGTDVEDAGMREDTYELCYNAACLLLGKGLYEEAEGKLKRAEELCRQLFEDDPDTAEDEVDAELGIIRVQLGYSLQQLGRNDEALKLYSQVIKTKPSDAGLAAVASNNVVTINKEQNVFDSKKKIKTATADGLQQKLTSKQRRVIEMNHCLLTMYMNQGEECRRMAERLRKMYPDSDTPSLIEAAQYWREKQVAKATELLTNQIAKREGEDVITLMLTLAQLYLGQGHVYKACDVMRSLGPCTYTPGMVAALVMLYSSEEDQEAAEAILDEAIEWHRANKAKGAELVALMRASVRYHLKHNNPQAAVGLLEDLRKRYPNDLKILAKLISAYSKFDSKKAQIISRELPSVENIAHEVDVDGLESSMAALAPKYIKKLTKGEQSPKPQSPMGGGDTLRQQKKKKKRKTVLPKSYDPEVTPDPERWLKRQERSYFRGKRRDKRKDIGKGTQGSVPTIGEKDSVKPTSASSSEVGSPLPGAPTPPTGTRSATATPSTPTPAPAGPRKQKPQGGKQKKKKKGGKW
ncbi:hypothetical protein NP493_158g04070 [Ridgeia piscesae]|uniref:Signal recognition particle subunit SRP72 n=1 Tax=Ridgeia piscesae TaxID=27915 RepID=A0AAD9P491_RIDPI|nr:hypothetical protein NP493_158g04070 [Ridgeia piscesae]